MVRYRQALGVVDPNAPVLDQLARGGSLRSLHPAFGPGAVGQGAPSPFMSGGMVYSPAMRAQPALPKSHPGLAPESDPLFQAPAGDPSASMNSPLYPHIYPGVGPRNSALAAKGANPAADAASAGDETTSSLRMGGRP